MAHDTTKLVSAFQASGLSQRAFCADRGIAVSVLQYHLTKMRKRSVNASGEGKSGENGCFVPLRVDATNSRHRTLVLIHGEIGLEEVRDLLRAVAG